MIADLFLQLLASIVTFLMGGLPTVETPAWLSSVDGPMATVMQGLGSMGVWFPVPLLATVVAAVFGAWLVGFGIKLVRIVASFLTLGGGSAA